MSGSSSAPGSLDGTERNKALVVKLYEAAGAHDWDEVERLAGAEIVFYEPESLPYGGRYVGPAGLKFISRRVLESTWQEVEFQLETINAVGDWVYSHTHMSAVGKSGKAFSFPVLEVFHFVDAKINEVRAYYWDTHRALEAFDS